MNQTSFESKVAEIIDKAIFTANIDKKELGALFRSLAPEKKTTTQINALTGMVAGDEYYNTTLNCPVFYNGTAWQKVTFTAM